MGRDRAGTGRIRHRRRALSLATLALVALSCAGEPRTVTGLVVSVDGDLTTVRSFTVQTEDGPLTFVPDPEGAFAFPPPHLGAHLRSGEPVRVAYEERDGVLVAVEIDDAEPTRPLDGS